MYYHLVHMDVVLVQFFLVWKFWFVVAAQADKLYVSTFLVLRQFCFTGGSEVALITCCRLDWFLDLCKKFCCVIFLDKWLIDEITTKRQSQMKVKVLFLQCIESESVYTSICSI